MPDFPGVSAIGSADQRTRPQGAPLAAASDSRLVIRDKRSTENPPLEALNPGPFPDRPVEDEEITPIGHGQVKVVARPIPNAAADPLVSHVDWLAFSFVAPSGEDIPWIIIELSRVFGVHSVGKRRTGWNGYTESAELGGAGLLAWGGKHQRGTFHIELNATGCKGIPNWRGVAAWGNSLGARITRVDLAHDDFKGEICNIEQVHAWWSANGFNSGGRSPKIKRAGDWDENTDGRTLYIGTRGNKMLRAYEKGKQQGFPNSPWCRVELELRGKNRAIPWEAVESPGQYLAGAYPCLKFLSEIQCKVKTNQKAGAMTLHVMTQNARRISGKAINVLMRVHNGDAEAVVAKLRREGTPKRLQPYSDDLGPPGASDENP